MTTSIEERSVEYTPDGAKEVIKLTLGMIRDHIATPTRTGKTPSDSDCLHFAMLCKAQSLDPWQGDAYMVGFDTDDGPKFSLMVAYNVLVRRAETHPAYEGKQEGLIVEDKDGNIKDVIGAFRSDDQKLLGAWVKIYRKDRTTPQETRIRFANYRQSNKMWNKDGEGMILKCCISAGFKQAFPALTRGFYTENEVGVTPEFIQSDSSPNTSSVADVNDRINNLSKEKTIPSEDVTVIPPDPDNDPPRNLTQSDPAGLRQPTTNESFRDRLVLEIEQNMPKSKIRFQEIVRDETKKRKNANNWKECDLPEIERIHAQVMIHAKAKGSKK